jgi:hypothetical protein
VRACVTTSKTVTTASDVCVTWTTAPVYVCWVDPWQPTPPPSIPGVGTYTPPPDGRAALAARCQQLGGTFSIPGTHCPSGKVECAYPPSKRCTQFAPPNVTTSYTTGWKTVQLGS